ncbi:MAG TPA: flagellar biosynthesis protein FlhB [Stellaceae bacterium]|nr:flagellar biosynthesis protein FlhB [Stellaceae bacterium]
MADDADKEQRTEEPSGRKLARARLQGQVVQSREVNTWFMLMAATGLLLVAGPTIAHTIVKALAPFVMPGNFIGSDGDVHWELLENSLGQIAVALAVPMLVAVAAAIAGTVVQIGLLFATEKFKLDITRLSPIAGLQRLFSLRSSIELLKNIAKIGIVSLVAWWVAMPSLDQLKRMAAESAEHLPFELQHLVLRLMLGVLAVVTVLAFGDYAYQRLAFMRSMRMTKQEVKEEFKQAEGDPKIKARLRQIRNERARKRMMAAVPKASVVITNPTHYAVALQYELGSAGAPKVVAKGVDLLAQRIREIAREHDVPIVENPPLARALYAHVELDREIPPEHYKAVAEIISYVFRLKGKIRPQARAL